MEPLRGVAQRPALTAFSMNSHSQLLQGLCGGDRARVERRRPREQARYRPPSLTLTQVYSLCREHQLLCQPLNNLQSLRRWLIELREFKPSLASRVTQPKDITVADVPKVGTQPPEGEPVSYRGMTSTGLQKEGESNAARISEFAFCRLLNDLDPLARLRDAAFELSMHTTQLSLKLPAPRHASRLAAETRGARWEHLGEAIRGLDALEAHLKVHTLGLSVSFRSSRRLRAAIQPRAPSASGDAVKCRCMTSSARRRCMGGTSRQGRSSPRTS